MHRPKFLVDENIETVLLRAIADHNASGFPPIEAIRVGDPPDLPLGSSDPELFRWIERHGYILVSHDVGTLPHYFGEHLAAGGHCPGLFLVSLEAELNDVVELLAAASDSEDAAQWSGLIEYLG